jgi:hypothetical protein
MKESELYRCKILKDSVSPEGKRLTSYEIEFPRCVLAEFVTHRMNSDTWLADIGERVKTPDVSKNSASSRAIPLGRMIQKVLEDPYVPERFGANQAGMQNSAWLEGEDHELAVKSWLHARNLAIGQAVCLLSDADRLKLHDMPAPAVHELRRIMSIPPKYPSPSVSVHKQDVNRLLEPWGWILQVVTATEWDNFFALRCDAAAAPAFRKIARMMYVLRSKFDPCPLNYGEWHLPYVDGDEALRYTAHPWQTLCDISAARCAWTSYWPPDGADGSDDFEKVKRTLKKLRESRPIHPSPFEHQATPTHPSRRGEASMRSNLVGWDQYRKMIPGEVTREYRPSAEEVASWGVTDEMLEAASR